MFRTVRVGGLTISHLYLMRLATVETLLPSSYTPIVLSDVLVEGLVAPATRNADPLHSWDFDDL